IMPRSASPEEIAASASSKVAQGIGSASAKASSMAMWELAPGSPWNAIFILLISRSAPAAPCNSGSGFGKDAAGGLQVRRGVNAAGNGIDDGEVDAHAGLERPKLLQLLLQLQRRGRQRDEPLQRCAAVGVKADMVVTRSVPGGGGGAGKIQRTHPLTPKRGSHRLHHAGGEVLLLGMDLRGQRRDVDRGVGERRQHVA